MKYKSERELLCEIGRRIWQKGFCAGNEGNHSLKVAEDRFLCTPSGVSKGFLLPEMICLIDGEGRLIEENSYRPSSEWKLHQAVYNNSPETCAVVHSHPPHATAFAVTGLKLPEGLCTESELFLGRVGYSAYATPGSQQLADNLAEVIVPGMNTVLMANHGAVSFGKDLLQTYYNLEILDAYCKIATLARSLGQIRPLSDNQMEGIYKVKQSLGIEDERALHPSCESVEERNKPFLNQID